MWNVIGTSFSRDSQTAFEKKSNEIEIKTQFRMLADVACFGRISRGFHDWHTGITNVFIIRHSGEHLRAVSEQRDEFKGGGKTTPMRQAHGYQQRLNGSHKPTSKTVKETSKKCHFWVRHQRTHKLIEPSLLWLPPSSRISAKLVNESASVYSF